MLSASFTVNLFVGVSAYGTYTLQIGQLANFTSTQVYLVDALLNTTTPLALGTACPIELTAANTNGTYAASNRFALLFPPSPTPLPVVLTSFTATAQPAYACAGPRLQVAYQAIDLRAGSATFELAAASQGPGPLPAAYAARQPAADAQNRARVAGSVF